MNGCILQNVHGSSGIMAQVSSAVSIVQGMCRLKTELLDESPCSDPLFTSLMKKYEHSTSNVTELAPNVSAVGATHNRKLSAKEYDALCQHFKYICCETDMKFFSRLKFSGGIIYAKCYTRCASRENSCVLLRNGLLGLVLFFVQHNPKECTCFVGTCMCKLSNSAVIEVLDPDRTSSLTSRPLRHIMHVRKSGQLFIADVTEITRKCFYHFNNEFQFVIELPNAWERN